MGPYQYPQVPRSSQLPPPQPPQPSREDDNRFSWVDTPAEAEGRMFNQRSEAPPLPQIPQHFQSQRSNLDQTPPRAYEQPRAPPQPAQPPQHRHPQPQYQPHPAPYLQQQISQDNHLHQHHQHPQQQAALPDQKDEGEMDNPHNVQAVQYASTTADHHQQLYSPTHPPLEPPSSPQRIAPDTNPLASHPSVKRPNREATTTNMAILPPPDPAAIPISSYTPTPQPLRGGTWHHSFCSCSEPSICITGLFCPCIVYGKTQYRLNRRSDKKDPTNMLGYSLINGSCVAFGLLCGINGILATIQHTRIRKAYEMDREAGNVVDDCVKGLCCCCCVVSQGEKEVKFREEEAGNAGHVQTNGGSGGNGRKEGYLPLGGMRFEAPPR